MESNHNEIRAYTKPKAAYAFVGLLLFLAASGLSVGPSPFPIALSTILVVVALWILNHPRSYISIDRDNNVMKSFVFGIKNWEVPISTITNIGTNGTFLGAIKIMIISYRKFNGEEKTVRAGSIQAIDKASLHKVLQALGEMKPSLHIPTEL
jgi:hypothetical protein